MLGSRLTGTKDKAALPCQWNWGGVGGGGAWGSVKGSPFSLLHPLKCIFLHSPPFFARHQNLRVRMRVTRSPSQGLWKALNLRDYRKKMVCFKSYATFCNDSVERLCSLVWYKPKKKSPGERRQINVSCKRKDLETFDGKREKKNSSPTHVLHPAPSLVVSSHTWSCHCKNFKVRQTVTKIDTSLTRREGGGLDPPTIPPYILCINAVESTFFPWQRGLD